MQPRRINFIKRFYSIAFCSDNYISCSRYFCSPEISTCWVSNPLVERARPLCGASCPCACDKKYRVCFNCNLIWYCRLELSVNMPGAREIGMMGAALALTGGVACAFCYLMHQTQQPKRKVKDDSNKEHVHKATKTETELKTPITSEVCWCPLGLSVIVVFSCTRGLYNSPVCISSLLL